MTTRDDDERRLASGWGARPRRSGDERERQEDRGARVTERRADLEESAEAGAISGRAVTNDPEGLGRGDQPIDEREEDEANLAQGDPLSGNPPT